MTAKKLATLDDMTGRVSTGLLPNGPGSTFPDFGENVCWTWDVYWPGGSLTMPHTAAAEDFTFYEIDLYLQSVVLTSAGLHSIEALVSTFWDTDAWDDSAATATVAAGHYVIVATGGTGAEYAIPTLPPGMVFASPPSPVYLSPNGHRWQLSVADDGTISATDLSA